MSSGKTKSSTTRASHLKTAKTTNVQIARDLRDDFDNYVLREDNAEHDPSEISQEEEEDIENRPHNIHNMQNIQNRSTLSKSKTDKKYRQTSGSKNDIQQQQQGMPSSFLMAMAHLQDVVETKNQEIAAVKEELLKKQQIILQCESRINQILHKYQVLMDMYSSQQSQLSVVKLQMQQLQLQKQKALKQAAKASEYQFKAAPVEPPLSETFKVRSFSTANFQRDANKSNNEEFKSDFGLSKKTLYGQQSLIANKTNQYLKSHQKSQKNRNFVSYQREILRNQKQLIALKYRMECYERKINTQPITQNLKQKMRTLNQQIQLKQRTINDLKRL